jgi:hypothetical protein
MNGQLDGVLLHYKESPPETTPKFNNEDHTSLNQLYFSKSKYFTISLGGHHRLLLRQRLEHYRQWPAIR